MALLYMMETERSIFYTIPKSILPLQEILQILSGKIHPTISGLEMKAGLIVIIAAPIHLLILVLIERTAQKTIPIAYCLGLSLQPIFGSLTRKQKLCVR